MSRAVVLTLIVLGLVASAGWGICVSAGWDPHRSSLLAALAVGLVATLLSFFPLWLARAADQLAVAQAGLVSTLVHLFVAIAACGFVILTKALPHGQSFVYWVMACYFATLIVVAATSAKAVRGARRVETTRAADVAPASVNRD